MNAFSALLLADSATVVGWTIVAVLTFLLIGLPTILLLVITLATSDEEIERTQRNIVQYNELKKRADVYASGKDIYGILETPLVLAPLAVADDAPARPPIGARVGTERARPRDSVGRDATVHAGARARRPAVQSPAADGAARPA
jgi:hypothetical protein